MSKLSVCDCASESEIRRFIDGVLVTQIKMSIICVTSGSNHVKLMLNYTYQLNYVFTPIHDNYLLFSVLPLACKQFQFCLNFNKNK